MNPFPILPSVSLYRLLTDQAQGWSDQYGAFHVAAAFAGLPPPDRRFPGVWQHGCFPPWVDYSPGLLVYQAPEAHKLPVFVAREEHASLLRAAGYRDVSAIGLPFAYVPEPAVERRARSLLVMPTHVMRGGEVMDPADFQRYADEIAALRDRFEHVSVCLHPNCRQEGFWTREFESIGVPIIDGARNNDRNALLRMRTLFSSFETVTTNGWGSHVAYALASGAKVAIHGTQPRCTPQSYLKDTTWAADPKALAQALSPDVAAREAAWLAPLRRHPSEAAPDVALGRWLVGADLRLSPMALRERFGSLWALQPEPPDSGHELRRHAVQEARDLFAKQGPAAAGKRLLTALQADLQSGDITRILSGLRVIAEEFARFDPTRADLLRREADRIRRELAAPAASTS